MPVFSRPAFFSVKIGVVTLLALGRGAAALPTAEESFDSFTERVAAEWVRADPQQATVIQYFSGAEQDAMDRKLVATDALTKLPIERSARSARVAQAERILGELAGYAAANLSPVQRISAKVIEARLRRLLDVAPYAENWFVFHQEGGLQSDLIGFLACTHPIRHRRDAENYLVRLEQIGPLLDFGVAEARAREAKGILPPKFVLGSVVSSIDGQLVRPAAKHALVTSLDDRLAKLTDVSTSERRALVAKAEVLVEKSVIPALGRVRILLFEQQSRAMERAGMGGLPRGEKAYLAALRANTAPDIKPYEHAAEVFEVVERNNAEIERLLGDLGYKEGTLDERFKKLDGRSRKTAEANSKNTVLDRCKMIVADAEVRARAAFGRIPQAKLEVKEFSSDGAEYNRPAPDGSRAAVFWAPGDTSNSDAGVALRSICYHEALPGHHLQIARQMEQAELPRFRRLDVFGSDPAFLEGWALYAERVAMELGWYDDDPAGKIGALYREQFCARRVLLDQKLHTQTMTLEEVTKYRFSEDEGARYAVWPGQACAYWIGEQRILRLREFAQRLLGSKFSLQEFHELILRTGNVPLEVLDEVVVDWMKTAVKNK